MRKLKQLLKPNRILPLFTVIGAATTIVLSTIGIVKADLVANIIIALLGLLAVDALTERMEILENIEKSLSKIKMGDNCLRPRNQVPKPTDFAENASEISILTLHGNSVIPPYANFYSEKLKAGCKLKIVLVAPNGPIQQFLDIIAKDMNLKIKERIEITMNALEPLLLQTKNGEKCCEVKLSAMYYPFSIVGVDINKPKGKIIVEFHSYQLPTNERPHVILSEETDSYGYNYYKNQFNEIWEIAAPAVIKKEAIHE